MPLTPSSPTALFVPNEDILYIVLSFSLSTLDLDHLALFMADEYFVANHRRLLAPNLKVLRVSKQWYRIGLPLLYRHVVLKKASRTTAVIRVLASKSWLGPAVRTLSIFGGMGPELSRLADFCPNIDTLVLSIRLVQSTHSAKGLLHILPKLRLKALCYDRRSQRAPARGNVVTRKIDRVVREQMVDTWSSSLKYVSLYENDLEFDRNRARFMLDVLLQLPFLEELRFTAYFLYSNMRWWDDASSFHRLLGAPRFKVIRCLGRRYQDSLPRSLQEIQLPRNLWDKIVSISVAMDYDLKQDWEHAREIIRYRGLVYESGHEPMLPLLPPLPLEW